MLLRELSKCNAANDGTRSLFESILVPEVMKAMIDWKKQSKHIGVLIGGLALSYYVKPRQTNDGDFLYLLRSDIPTEVPGFKRTRPGAYLHKETHVEIEVLIPKAINVSNALATKVVATSVEKDGFRIASRAGLIAIKLGRFSLQDRADISALFKLGALDLSEYPLDEKETANLKTALAEVE